MDRITLVKDTIDNNDIDRLIDWLKTYPRLTKGPVTLELEEKYSKWIGRTYSVFCNSGSSANLLMLSALQQGKYLKNNKVVVPSVAWATDLAPVMQLGLEPILCDSNKRDLSADLFHLEKIFQDESPSALMLVSVLGLVPEMGKVVNLCKKYDVILLEDTCESMGSKYRDTKLGTFGRMSSFSTFFGHHISTIEGGFVSTDDKDLYDILVSIRAHGWARDLDTEKQIELQQDWGVSTFNSLYTFYYQGFNDFTSNFAYPVIHPNKTKIVEKLFANNVDVRPMICGSMGTQPFYVKEYGRLELPNVKEIDEYGFYVPNNPHITDNEIVYISDIINGEIND